MGWNDLTNSGAQAAEVPKLFHDNASRFAQRCWHVASTQVQAAVGASTRST